MTIDAGAMLETGSEPMDSDKIPRSTLTEHLDSSIERVHQNLEAVSFWAHAVSGFAQPIPAYVPEESVSGFQAHPFSPGPRALGKAPQSKTRGKVRARQ
jgi:hypothetical protein